MNETCARCGATNHWVAWSAADGENRCVNCVSKVGQPRWARPDGATT